MKSSKQSLLETPLRNVAATYKACLERTDACFAAQPDIDNFHALSETAAYKKMVAPSDEAFLDACDELREALRSIGEEKDRPEQVLVDGVIINMEDEHVSVCTLDSIPTIEDL